MVINALHHTLSVLSRCVGDLTGHAGRYYHPMNTGHGEAMKGVTPTVDRTLSTAYHHTDTRLLRLAHTA